MAYKEATDKTFDEIIGGDFAIVDCYGDHCGPCRILAPIFEEVTSEFDFITFAKFNTEHNTTATERYAVNSIPTMLFFRNGELVDRTVGVLPKEEIKVKISELLYK